MDGRHMGICHLEAAAAAAPRALNPIHTCHSASQLSQQPQGKPARGRSLRALWVNERSIRLSNQQPLEERPLALMHGSFWGTRRQETPPRSRAELLGSFKHAPSWLRTPTGNRSAFCQCQALGSSWLT